MIKFETNLKDEAQQHFNDLQVCRDLLEGQVQQRAFSATDLYAYVYGAENSALKQALVFNLNLRRAYKGMLKGAASYKIGYAQAASSTDYPERHVDGCRLRVHSSNAEAQQLYLILEFRDKNIPLPEQLVIFDDQERMETFDLPQGRNGVIQALIERQSLIADLLKSPKTEIFLR